MRTLVGLLLALTLDEIDEGGVAAELDGTLWNGKDLVGSSKNDFSVGTIARTQLIILGHMDSGLDLKLIGTIRFDSLWRDIFQGGIELQVLQGTDGNLHGHTTDELADFRLVDITAEDKVVHVSHTGNGGTVVESVRQDDAVTDLDGNVENDTADGRADERGRQDSFWL